MVDPIMLTTHLVIFWTGFMFLCGAEAITSCRDLQCQQDSECKGTACLHGSCDDSGECLCVGCWEGDSCDTSGNPHVPYFDDILYEVHVRADHQHQTPLVRVQAEDDDARNCPETEECGCARIKYTIQDGNDLGQFSIDPQSGDIYADALVDFTNGVSKRVYLTVGAENEGYNMYGRTIREATVVIIIEGGPRNDYGGFKANYAENSQSESLPDFEMYGETDKIRRTKRDLSSLTPGVDNVEFHFTKTADYENKTTLKVGGKVHFQLGIQFPADTNDILVELFTPDNETTLMVLCNVEIVSIGSALRLNEEDVSAEDVEITLEARTEKSYDYDRAIIDFGNVSHTGNPISVATDEMIVLEWDVVMIDSSATQNGSTYWVSAGAEYNNQEEIWVGQASFEAITEVQETADTPVFNFTGPEKVVMGTSSVFRVDMYIPYASVELVFDVFAPINDSGVMSLCNVLVVDTGEHYKCLPKEKIDYTLYEAANPKANDRARLNIGTVTNAGVDESIFGDNLDLNRISVEFVLYVFEDAAYTGNSYWVGAAVEIGSDLIWAAQLSVEVTSNEAVLGVPSDPVLKLTTLTDTGVVIGQTIVYVLNMTLPQNSEGVYQLEILAPYNDSAARMKLCGVKIIAQGVNVPCFKETFPEFSSRDDSNVTDRAVWSLHRIRNTGQREDALDPYADVLSFQIIAQVLNHSLNTVGEKISLTVGVTINDDKLWVGTNGVVIIGSSSLGADPTFKMDYGFGTDQVEIGGASQLLFEITTKLDSIYAPMSLEFIMPHENDTAVLRICRTEVISKGTNLPCFDREAINSSITYSSKNDDDIYDMAVVSMGTVCNIKESDDNDTTEDTIVVSVIVQVQDHENLIEGSKKWLSAGITYTETNMFLGQLALFTIKDTPASYAGPDEPFFDINRTDSQPDGEYTYTVGIPATYLLTIKALPQSRADFTVVVTASSGLSVCLVRVKEVGWNLPCVDSEMEAQYTQHADSDYSDTGTLAFGPITNVADEEVVLDDTFDNNTITIEFVVMAYEAGSTTLDVTVDYGPTSPGSPKNLINSPYSVVALATPLVTTDENKPALNLSISGVNENQTVTHEMAKAQTLVFNLDIYPAQNTQHEMLVKFLTPVNQTAVMEVCSVNLVYVGKNIPCLRKKVINQGNTYESRTIAGDPDHNYIDIGTVALGHVCHMPIYESDPENRLVRVEAVAKVTANNSLSVGEQIWFSATVRVNDDQMYVAQTAITITEDFTNTHLNLDEEVNVTLNTPAGAIEMAPGDITDIFVHVDVQANISVTAYMDVSLPFSDSAIMTVHHVEVVEVGKNIGCLTSNPDKEILIEYNSTGASTQNNYVMYDYKIITNSGETYRTDTYEEGDNTFVTLVQVQLADAKSSIHGSEHMISIGVKLGETIFLVEKKVVVIRDGSEVPDLLLTADVNETDIYTTSDDIIIDAMLRHTNESKAEGYNVTATFYFPSFMNFANLLTVNFTTPHISDSTEGHGLQFKFDSLYFTDIVAFSFLLHINPSLDIPVSGSPVDATTPFEAGANIIHRTGHLNEANTWFVTRVDSLSFGVIGPGGIGCVAIPLGMEDGSIQDCQIQSSDSPDDSRLAEHGRMRGPSAWTAGTRAGQFSRYMQVDFGNVTKLTSLELRHEGGASFSRLNDIQLLYSDDSINWDDYPTETLTANAGYSETILSLLTSVEARYVRLVLVDDQSANLMPSLQVEFHGCTSTSDKTLEQVCNERQTSWLNQEPSSLLYKRSLVVADSIQYFCDANPTKEDQMECFTRDGSNVMPMDESVVTVLGYWQDTSELYALAWDQRSIVSSSDQGQTWMSVSTSRYTEAQNSVTWIPAADVPYIKDITVSNFSPVEAKYDGIYESNARVTSWDTCC